MLNFDHRMHKTRKVLQKHLNTLGRKKGVSMWLVCVPTEEEALLHDSPIKYNIVQYKLVVVAKCRGYFCRYRYLCSCIYKISLENGTRNNVF